MNREHAYKLLAEQDPLRLSREMRQSILMDWWTIDAEDPDYQELPNDLRVKLTTLNEPHDPMDPLYEPLLLLAARRSFVGTAKEYLEGRLAQVGYKVKVSGSVERLAACPCCQYRSLRRRGVYEICQVCFWEDDGTNDLNIPSGPNHMTLGEARNNLGRFGAVSESARPHVLADGASRFLKDESGAAEGG